MRPMRKITRAEDADLTRRLLASMPASRFEMQTLCRLAGITASRQLPTAAVECKRRPRLLINPDFVSKYCERDEHLFLLVMHELWHVQLAHTRMYPRMTRLQNIALDAIINSGLMREFSTPEYRGFFDAVNPADKFPSCLLRPPEGWPYAPQYPTDIGPPGTTEMVRRLYPPGNARFSTPPLYEEVLSLLLKGGMQWIDDDFMLLGNHDPRGIHDPLMKDFMQQVASKWPKPMANYPGFGGAMRRHRYELADVSEDCRRAFAGVLRLALGRRPGRERRKSKVPVRSEGGTGVIPNPRDRLAPARARLGQPNTLWAQPADVRVRLPEKPSRAIVYLDVSGSMYNYIQHLMGLLLPYVANRQAEVYQFSTEVAPLTFSDLRNGELSTSGGTSINCVLRHLLEIDPPAQKVLLLTDGAVGMPAPDLKREVMELEPTIYTVMPSDCDLNWGCKDMMKSIVKLPPLF